MQDEQRCILHNPVSAKGRRQPKPVKPKKMIRLESKQVVFAACNSGSSAVVTKDGEVYMFGKDTSHCDHASGELPSFGRQVLCILIPFFVSC